MRGKPRNNKDKETKISDDMVNALVDKILEDPRAKDKLLRSVAHGVGRRALMAGAGGVLAGMAGMSNVGGSTFVTEDSSTSTGTNDGSNVPRGAYSVIVYKDGDEVVAEDSRGNLISKGEADVDDANVIQNAIDNVKSIGGTIHIDRGTYNLNKAIIIDDNDVKLVGPGHRATTLRNENNTDIIHIKNHGFIIENIKLILRVDNNQNAAVHVEDVNEYFTKGKIENCEFFRRPDFSSGLTGSGIRLDSNHSNSISFITIRDCQFFGGFEYGVHIKADGAGNFNFNNGNLVADCLFYDIKYGAYLEQLNGADTNANLFYGCKHQWAERSVNMFHIEGDRNELWGNRCWDFGTDDVIVDVVSGAENNRINFGYLQGGELKGISDNGDYTVINNVGSELANAEEPQFKYWDIGHIVKFVDTGDGSGNGIYMKLPDGSWKQIGSV